MKGNFNDKSDFSDNENQRVSFEMSPDFEVKLRRKERIPKCCVVGDGGAGKTSMMMRYTSGRILTEYQPTCFENYMVDVKDGEICRQMCVMDTAGQETYDRLRTLAYHDTDVFVVCFSVYDRDSFENVKSKWVPEIKQFRPNTPYIIVGTHTDLRHSVVDITDACISTSRGKKVAKKLGAIKYLECSSIDGTGLDEVFQVAFTSSARPNKRKHTWKSFKNAFKRRTVAF